MREDIQFDAEGATLRGWFYRPDDAGGRSRASSCRTGSRRSRRCTSTTTRRSSADAGLACVVFDNRGLGESDAAPGKPRRRSTRGSRSATTSTRSRYAQLRPEVDAARIGVWGSSYSAAHAYVVAAIDRRVKAVCGQVPLISGRRRSRCWCGSTSGGRPGRCSPPTARPAPAARRRPCCRSSTPTRLAQSALPTPDSYEFFTEYEGSSWRNEVTLRTLEMFQGYEPGEYLKRISPTPLLMVVAPNDRLVAGELACAAFETAAHPKKLVLVPGGHFDAYVGRGFEISSGAARDWFVEHLLTAARVPATA